MNFYFLPLQPVFLEDLSHLPLEHRSADIHLHETGGPKAEAQRSPFGGGYGGATKRQSQVV